MTGPTPVRTRRGLLTYLIGGAAAIVVLVVVGWLVWPNPPSATVLHTRTPHGDVTVTVDHPKVGSTSVTIDLAEEPAGVTVQPTMPHMGYSAPDVTAEHDGAGRYQAHDVSFMMTGVWEIRVKVAQSSGESDIMVVPVNVSG